MQNERCSDPATHGRARAVARPPTPPLTQLQCDALRAQVYAFVDDVKSWYPLDEREMLHLLLSFYHHVTFTLAGYRSADVPPDAH